MLTLMLTNTVALQIGANDSVQCEYE